MSQSLPTACLARLLTEQAFSAEEQKDDPLVSVCLRQKLPPETDTFLAIDL